jgi:FkbM family methyltransferase
MSPAPSVNALPEREFELAAFDPLEWREGFSWPMKVANLWVKYVPRGKGWFPRWVGKNLCARHRVFTRTLHGAKLAVEPADLDVYTYIVSQGNSWDEHVVDACKSVMAGGGVFYDVGASVGYISMEMAAMLNPGGCVIAFEPQPALASIVAVSARLNRFDHLRVFQVMLGDHAGEEALHVGSHSIHASAIAREAGSSRLQCRMITLDALVSSGAIPPPTVIKIDVEGAEREVVSGARHTIREHRPHILFESDENMDRYGYARKDILDLLGALCRYEFFFVTAKKERVPLSSDNLESRQHADVLAVPVT